MNFLKGVIMADFPRKYLVYTAKSIEGDVGVALDEFDAALAARRGSIRNTGVFLPNMSAIDGPTTCNVRVNDGSSTTSIGKVYGIHPDGFRYWFVKMLHSGTECMNTLTLKTHHPDPDLVEMTTVT